MAGAVVSDVVVRYRRGSAIQSVTYARQVVPDVVLFFARMGLGLVITGPLDEMNL